MTLSRQHFNCTSKFFYMEMHLFPDLIHWDNRKVMLVQLDEYLTCRFGSHHTHTQQPPTPLLFFFLVHLSSTSHQNIEKHFTL